MNAGDMAGEIRGEIWIVILALGLGTYLVRISFIGLLGGRTLPDRALRMLRYVPVAVMPGLVAPLVVWPQATGGSPDAARLLAAAAALIVGAWRRSVIGAVGTGMAVLYLALWALG